ncbi:HNH endonuclease signature motif containing protein [Mycobacteroides abscessus]|nr:HNH endonuclease signature motif containing protein [Mycobacteroides abscessus]MDM2455702.1 HNH endonuclease signature motif containing protein [Mycobacteroides abscessus]MDM2460454.1 HNH endonuclease signature motif containing protein [Mycobacteroides abscessus]MDM2484837.1 HNH endonuclease signature motif containing protein [Mycobacteroides abscessus]
MTQVSPTVRRDLHERAMHCCEVCGKHGATNAHHRVNASQGGRGTLANLLLVCGSGTMGCHGRITVHPNWAKAHGYSVRPGDEPSCVPVLRWSRYLGAHEPVLLDDEGNVEWTDQEVGQPCQSARL